MLPFWIDIDAYTDRDRLMFVCGFEFQQVYTAALKDGRVERPVHRENESRIRMMCGKFGWQCEIVPHEGYEGCETWSDLALTVPRHDREE